MSPLAAIGLRIILAFLPIDAPRIVPPGWEESREARLARFGSIATDAAGAAEDACGDRKDCAAWALPALLGIAWHESAFELSVDVGRCYRNRDGKGPQCDAGQAWGLWQLRGSAEEGRLWTTDRRAGAREALRRIFRSLRACRALPAPERLSAYAGGRCEGETAAKRARELHAAIERARAVR